MEDDNEFIENESEELEQINDAENTDTQTVEENVGEVDNTTHGREKVFTQEELNDIVSRRVARAENRVKREYEEKYSKLDNTLNTALGTNSPEESANKLIEFYKEQGINIPDEPRYSERDLELLAKAEAESIINSSYEDLVDEVDRLANKGIDNMTRREKLVFKSLAEERQRQEQIKELASIGVSEDTLSNKDFRNFADKFDRSKISMKEIYEMYEKTIPKKEVKPIGSMKSDPNKDEVKDYYSFEDAQKFTRKDFDKNPKLFEAVEKSMLKWGKK